MPFAMIQAATAEPLAGYLAGQQGHALQKLIVPPQLGADAGAAGSGYQVSRASDAVHPRDRIFAGGSLP